MGFLKMKEAAGEPHPSVAARNELLEIIEKIPLISVLVLTRDDDLTNNKGEWQSAKEHTGSIVSRSVRLSVLLPTRAWESVPR